jgi:S1-C subfamily serine protease
MMSMCGTRKISVSWRLAKFCFAGVLTLSTAAVSSAPVTQTDIRRDATVEAISEVIPAVVNVGAEVVDPAVDPNDPFERFLRSFNPVRPSLGSGVIFDEDGYLLTNLHVVENARQIKIKLSEEAGGGEYDVENIFVGAPTTDIAVLKLVPKRPGEKFRAVKLARDDDLLLGETVIALGNPFGLGGSVSRGILSSKRRAIAKEKEKLNIANWLQTDASINPGNSGGPLVNLRGELIGINTAVLQEAQGIGFAIPIKEVRATLAELFAPETNARWFGARVQPGTSPPVVRSVKAKSPADQAGLRAGDVIFDVNGKPAKNFIEFNRLLRDEPQGTVALGIQRDGERRTIDVKVVPFESLRQKMGADLQELTPELARSFGFKVDAGLLIARVERNGPADRARLQRGFLITALDEKPIKGFTEALGIIAGKKTGQTVDVSVIAPDIRGNMIFGYSEGTATLKLR